MIYQINKTIKMKLFKYMHRIYGFRNIFISFSLSFLILTYKVTDGFENMEAFVAAFLFTIITISMTISYMILQTEKLPDT